MIENKENEMTTGTVITLRCNSMGTQVLKIWSQQGSFFWKQLLKIRPLFLWSTRWHIGTGATISFWFDSWTYPTMSESELRLTNRNISLKDAVTLSLSPHEIEFSEGEDQLYWIWSTSACYSAKSLYDVMMAGGKTISEFKQTWNFKIPPTVRIFAYLLFQGKILTHDVMERRGFNCDMGCITCDNCSMETAMHLFFQCRFAIALWNRMAALLGHRIMWPDHTVRLTYLTSWRRRMTNIPR